MTRSSQGCVSESFASFASRGGAGGCLLSRLLMLPLVRGRESRVPAHAACQLRAVTGGAFFIISDIQAVWPTGVSIHAGAAQG